METETPAPRAEATRVTGPRISVALRRRLIFLLVGNVLLLGVIFGQLKEGGSFTQVLTRAAANISPTVLAGLGMTGVVFTGAIDLSVASTIALTATIFGILVGHSAPPWLCFAGCVGTAWGVSMLNASLVRALRVPAIIITLAGLTFYRGAALILADMGIPNFGGSLSVPVEAYHMPGKFYAGPILAVVVAVALLWERFSRWVRHWLALGSSPEACRLAGLNPGRILQTAFCVNGIFVGLAALIAVTRVQYIEPARMGLGFEMQVIGAVVLGGTHIFGGEGSYLGTVLGAFFLHFITETLIYAAVSPYFQEAIAGLLILGVITLDCALHRKRKLLEELT